MSHIFVSYSRKDSGLVEAVVNELRGGGYPIWLDTTNIPGGANWEHEIQTAVKDAAAALVFWSTNAAAKPDYIQGEYQAAKDADLPIIAIMLNDIELPISLRATQGIMSIGADARTIVEQICNDRTIKALCRPQKLKSDVRLADQPGAVEVPETDLVAAPLLQGGFTKASVIGQPDKVVKTPLDKIQVCLEFGSRGREFGVPRDVYGYLKSPKDVVMLYIHHQEHPCDLPLDNSAPWRDAIDTAYQAVHLFKSTPYPTLQIFAYAPNMLTFGVGKRLFKFWAAELYQNTGGQYYHVLTMHAE